MTSFLRHGEYETVKGVAHGVAAGLLAVFAMYNLAAWRKRGESHLAVNAVLYCGAVGLELVQVARHFEPKDSACGR